MARREKILEKIKENPKHVTFEALDRLLVAYGFERREPRRGSHYVYVRGATRITVPYRRPHVREHYVRKALELIEEVASEEPKNEGS